MSVKEDKIHTKLLNDHHICTFKVCASLLCTYHMTEAGSIVLVGALTRCALLHSMCDLKATQMDIQRSLIRKIMLFEFELDQNAAEATKNICCAKGEYAVDHSVVRRCSRNSLELQESQQSGKVR